MVTPATLVHRNADYGNTWQRAAVVRPYGHRPVCHPLRRALRADLQSVAHHVRRRWPARTADGSLVNQASAVN